MWRLQVVMEIKVKKWVELLRVECEVVGKMQKSLGNENCYEK